MIVGYASGRLAPARLVDGDGRLEDRGPATLQGLQHPVELVAKLQQVVTLAQPDRADSLALGNTVHGVAEADQRADEAVGEANGVPGYHRDEQQQTDAHGQVIAQHAEELLAEVIDA